ncbi:MAG: urea carboxylase-associated family protein, partial [Thiohalobacterales bacterium]|nr:urea carboxylase-associated family protein [Thiohalobacterales bacterium]
MSTLTESPLRPEDAVSDEIVKAGDAWLKDLQSGQTLRILDLEGNQAVDTLFYNAHDPSERYSAVDTIRAQGNLYLTTGSQLMSTDGNVMLTITADTCGRHDTLGGAC